MARVGYLMLRDGKWNGKQIISKPWHDSIISVVTPWEQMDGKTSIPRFEYGYMWWLFAPQSPLYKPEYKGAYSARGAMGQYITVIPELDMVVAFKTEGDPNALRKQGDSLRDKEPAIVALLAAVNGEKLSFLCVCGKEAVAAGVKAGDLIRQISAIAGGKGGGKPDSAMGGGTDVSKLDAAVASLKPFVEEIVSK